MLKMIGCAAILGIAALGSSAQEKGPLAPSLVAASALQEGVIAKQGPATVDGLDVDAHMATVPPADRAAYIDSPKRIEQMLSHMLLRRNLAMEARELKLDQDPIVKRQMEQAAEGVLMGLRLQQLEKTIVVPDLEPLARERYLADNKRFKVPEKVTARHILLDTKKRTAAEAVALLEKFRAEILAGTATMEALAKAHSEDPGVGTNGGLYEYYDPTKFVPEFASAIAALKTPGAISPVVQTEFGYHLIELVERIPERIPSYTEISGQLLEQARTKFISDAQKAHIERLKTLPVEASEESIVPLRSRYGVVEHRAAEPASKPESPAPVAPPVNNE